MLGSGVDGLSGSEVMMFAGGPDELSEGTRVSFRSSSTLIVLIFFLLLSSFSFFLGKDISNNAAGKRKMNTLTACHEISEKKTLTRDL